MSGATPESAPVTRFLLLTTLAVAGLAGLPALADPGAGTLYATDAGLGNLLTVDPATGIGTVVGPIAIEQGFPSLAVDPATGVLYAGGGSGDPILYTVDPTTGLGTPVGDSGLGLASIGALEFGPGGVLYASVNIAGNGGTGADHLATLDPATGVATVIGPFGVCMGVTIPSDGDGSCTVEGIEGIAFDAAGNLWGSHSVRGAAGPPGLYTIDPGTGAATFVAPIADGLGSPPSGGVVSLQFGCDGTLYGGTATAIEANDGGFLVTIDPATGLFSFVGPFGATEGSSLGALAFGAGCLEILKTPELQFVTEGQTATFTISVSNTGTVGLTNVTVDDPATPSCSRNLGPLAPGERTSYSCTTDPLLESFVNLASVHADGLIGEEANAFVEVLPKLIEITKTPDVQVLPAGSIASFTIDVSNLTEVALVGIVVDDPLTPDCSRGGGEPPGQLPLPDLGPFETLSYTCDTGPLFADLTNVATVTAEAARPQPAASAGERNVAARGLAILTVTDTDDAFVDILQPIEIAKEPSEQFVAPGESATFTITVNNPSDTDTLTNIVVSDPTTPDCDRALGSLGPGASSTPYACTTGPLFANLVNVATVAADAPGGSVTASSDANVQVAETRIEISKEPPLQILPAGSTATFTVTVTNPDPTGKDNVVVTDPATPACNRNLGNLGPAASTSYTCTTGPLLADLLNLARVTADSVTGPVLAQDSAFVDIDEPLAITKQPGFQTVDPGATATFTITVDSLGTLAKTHVVVSDPATPACDRNLGNLGPGASVSYQCTTGPLSQDFENVATVTADTAVGQAAATASALVDVANPLEIVKTALTPLVPIGAIATFRITLTNTTMDLMTSIAVTDPLTPGCDRATGVLDDLPGETSISYTCMTGALDADLTNVATVNAVSPGGPVSASASATVRVFDPKFWSGPTATGTGIASLIFVGGGPSCGFGDAAAVPLTGGAFSPPDGSAPPRIVFPHGLFHLMIENCEPGFTADFILTLPQVLPLETQLWKYGPTSDIPAPHWYILPAVIAGNTIAFSVTDGGLGDNDLTADGQLVDPFGPGARISVLAIPTLGPWALALLAALIALGGLILVRRGV